MENKGENKMKLKKCTKCNCVPEISNKDGTWTVSCKCGVERTLIVTGNRTKEVAIAQYNANMCPSKGDIIITITIPEDKENVPISISCNAPHDEWRTRIEEVGDTLVKRLTDFVK